MLELRTGELRYNYKGGGRDFIVGGGGARMLESNHLLESNQYYDSIMTNMGVSHEKVGGRAPPPRSFAYELPCAVVSLLPIDVSLPLQLIACSHLWNHPI